MELDITDFYNNAAPRDYSASRAELGQDAGTITWSHACEDAPEYNILDTDEKREEFRAHVADFGAWSDAETNAWSNTELNALLIQFIAGDIREGPLSDDSEDWEGYQKATEAGQCAGNLSKGVDGRIYYYVGS